MQTLLDACLRAAAQKGGTIHEFLPRLQWKLQRNGGRVSEPRWALLLDDVELATFDGDEPPAIEPSMGRNRNVFWS